VKLVFFQASGMMVKI